MLSFAIIGCGMIARFHGRALAEVPGARLVALVSRKAENARRLPITLESPAQSTPNGHRCWLALMSMS